MYQALRIKKILKYLIALAVSIAIAYLGYWCGENLYTEPSKNNEWSWKYWGYFIGFYVIVVRPVCNYWTDIISDALDIKKNDE